MNRREFVSSSTAAAALSSATVVPRHQHAFQGKEARPDETRMPE